jgi:hypothetical protein
LLFKNVDFTFRHDDDHEVCTFCVSEAYSLHEVGSLTGGSRDLTDLSGAATISLPKDNAVVRNGGRYHLVSLSHIDGDDITDVLTRLGSVADRFDSIRHTRLRDEGDVSFPTSYTSALLATFLEEQNVRYLML